MQRRESARVVRVTAVSSATGAPVIFTLAFLTVSRANATRQEVNRSSAVTAPLMANVRANRTQPVVVATLVFRPLSASSPSSPPPLPPPLNNRNLLPFLRLLHLRRRPDACRASALDDPTPVRKRNSFGHR